MNFFHRLRAWRLHREADDLLRRARRHEISARIHRAAASRYTIEASRVRQLARHIEAARSVP